MPLGPYVQKGSERSFLIHLPHCTDDSTALCLSLSIFSGRLYMLSCHASRYFYCPHLNLPYSWKKQATLSQITGCQTFKYASQLVCAYILHMLGSNDLCKCALPIQLLEYFQHYSLNVIWLVNPAPKSQPFGELQSNTLLNLISLWQTRRMQTNQNQTPEVIQTLKILLEITTIYIYVYVVYALWFL